MNRETNLTPYLFTLSVIKRLWLKQTYSQSIYALVALFYFFSHKLFINKVYIGICLVLVANMIVGYVKFESFHYLEYLQLLSLIAISFGVFYTYNKRTYFVYARTMTTISSFITALYILIPEEHYSGRSYLGIDRIPGLIGEPNYSAIALTLPFIILHRNRNYFWLALCFANIWIVQSRGGFIFLILYIILSSLKSNGKMQKTLSLLLILLSLMSPFIVSTIYNSSSNSFKRTLVTKVSTRFYLTDYYTSIGINNLTGTGILNSYYDYRQQGSTYREKVLNELKLNEVEANEQHSIFNQLLSDFGIIFYSMIILAFLTYLRYLYTYKSIYILSSLISPLVFANGLTELMPYIGIAYFLFLNKATEQ